MNFADPVAILRIVAKRLGSRVKRCEVYDDNVCQFRVDVAHHWKPVAISGYPFSQEMRRLHNGRRLALWASSDYVRVEVKGELRVGGMCSINKANQTQFMEASPILVGSDRRWPVFMPRNSQVSDALRSFLESSALNTALGQLLKHESASLHIFEGGIVLYSKPNDADELMGYVETLSELVGPLQRDAGSMDLSGLPAEFRHLVPLIVKWAESDDSERTELLDRSSRKSLRDLVETVAPEFERINQYLNSFQDKAMPEAVSALGSLAEAAAEAQLRLRQGENGSV